MTMVMMMMVMMMMVMMPCSLCHAVQARAAADRRGGPCRGDGPQFGRADPAPIHCRVGDAAR